MYKRKRGSTIAAVAIFLLAAAGLAYLGMSNRYAGTKKVYHLSIVAAHNDQMKELVVPFLKNKCKERYGAQLHVDWVKYGGQNANIKVISTAFEKHKERTCGYDVIWGGGESIFGKLHNQGRLATFTLPHDLKAQIPATLAGVVLQPHTTWLAASLSTFGIIYNKELFNKQGLAAPTSWEDLARVELFNKISAVDPTQSSSIWTIYAVMLQTYGWQKGWEVFTKMAANTVSFLEKASTSAGSVTQGNALATPSIGYYAQDMIDTLGKEKIGFALPLHQTIVNPDPIAILKGAPNPEMARFCLETILSAEFQALIMRKKGTLHGPAHHTFGRIAINKLAYEVADKSGIACVLNPFDLTQAPMQLDVGKAQRQYAVLAALFKACYISPHKQLKRAWQVVIANGCHPAAVRELTAPMLTEKELDDMAERWDADPLFRTKQRITWENNAKARYQKVIKGCRRDNVAKSS